MGMYILLKRLALRRYGLTLEQLVLEEDKLVELLKQVFNDGWSIALKAVQRMCNIEGQGNDNKQAKKHTINTSAREYQHAATL